MSSDLSRTLTEVAEQAVKNSRSGYDAIARRTASDVLNALADWYAEHGGIFGAAHIVALREHASEIAVQPKLKRGAG